MKYGRPLATYRSGSSHDHLHSNLCYRFTLRVEPDWLDCQRHPPPFARTRASSPMRPANRAPKPKKKQPFTPCKDCVIVCTCEMGTLAATEWISFSICACSFSGGTDVRT